MAQAVVSGRRASVAVASCWSRQPSVPGPGSLSRAVNRRTSRQRDPVEVAQAGSRTARRAVTIQVTLLQRLRLEVTFRLPVCHRQARAPSLLAGARPPGLRPGKWTPKPDALEWAGTAPPSALPDALSRAARKIRSSWLR